MVTVARARILMLFMVITPVAVDHPTGSVVPASMVPSYHGTSSYLIMTKYNEYAGYGGTTGQNMLAVLDPNATQINELPNTAGTTEMK